MNSIPPNTPSHSGIEVTVDKKESAAETKNKSIKNLYGDNSKAEMLTAYMNRMNLLYGSVRQVIDEKKAEIN
jgi:hypothetical protein